jgi:polysaccharide biosynthesis protein PslG
VAITFGVTPAQTAVPRESATLGERIGFATSTVWLAPDEAYRYLRQARDGGITWIREDFRWSAIEPERGRYSWARTDALMRNASLLGLHVLALPSYAPGWASGHEDTDAYPPTRPADYAIFAKAVADRYAAGGTFWRLHPRLRPSPLTAIELWNEPWLSASWRSGPDPAAYARLVRAAATRVKATHPGITILAAGDVAEGNPGWLQGLLRADIGLWRSKLVDAWSVHPYGHGLSPWDTTVPQDARFDRVLLTRIQSRNAGVDKPIWITELGWRTDPGPDAVDEATQAVFVRDALLRATTEWRSFVRRSFVFTWTKPSLESDYNLIRPDGSTRPAWAAIQRLAARTA